jgi:C4-type Zn-finger protein
MLTLDLEKCPACGHDCEIVDCDIDVYHPDGSFSPTVIHEIVCKNCNHEQPWEHTPEED